MDTSAPSEPPASLSAPIPPPPFTPAPAPAQPPLTRFPPFPSPPSSSGSPPILPFSKFKEHGIQIFADPSTGIELDGLGIPTVRLRVPHDTDVCKTTAKPKPKPKPENGDDAEDGEEEGGAEEEDDPDEGAKKRKKRKKKKKFPSQLQDHNDGTTSTSQSSNKNRKNTSLPIDLSTISDPVERAQEQKRQRLLMFAKQEWWEQWAAGEDLRKGRPVYDSSLPPTDRIHLAATDFRTGRIWPPASTQLRYLWDQLRLYTGLLGSTPVWKRVDLVDTHGTKANGDADDGDDNEDSDDEESFARQSSSTKSKPKPKPKRDPNWDSDFDEEEEPEEEQEQEREPTPPPRPPQTPHKRIPPRAPYALFSYKPIIVPHIPSSPSSASNSSKPTPKDLTPLAQSQIPLLLSLASSLRHTRLLTFLSSPVQVISEFLSSYVYSQGLVYAAPGRMVGVGRLVVFFLEFVLRVGALREDGGGGPRKGGDRTGRGKGNVEREFSKAAEVARRAALEIPRAGWVVRVCPDVLGRGCEGVWGRVWREAGWWGGADAGGVGGDGDGDDKEVKVDGGDGGKGTDGDGKDEGKDGVDKEEEGEEEDEAARMKRFEDELRAANVQLVSADPLELGVPPAHEDEVEDGGVQVLGRIAEDEEEPIVINTNTHTPIDTEIDIDVVSPLSPGYIESASSDSEGQRTPTLTPRVSIVKIVDDDAVTETQSQSQIEKQTQPQTEKQTKTQITGDTDAPILAETDSTAADQKHNQGPDRIQITPRSEADIPPSTNAERQAEKGSETDDDDVTRSASASAPDIDWARAPNARDTNDKPRAEKERLEDERSPWLPPAIQPLFGVLGSMSAFPLRFAPGGRNADVGCVEKSVRRVKEIIIPTSSAAAGEGAAPANKDKAQKWTGNGAEEALVDAFARVVLEPWVDWDDAGCAGLYTVPRVQGPRTLTQEEELAAAPSPSADEDDNDNDEGAESTTISPEQEARKQKASRVKRIVYERTKYAHDPVQDEITVLMEPRVAEALSVGMGMVGTWVQLVPVPPPPSFSSSSHSGSGGRGGRGRGRGRGRGDARGRGRGRGGAANHGGPPPKQHTFWYIEDLHMAVPSYWAVPPRGVPGSLLAEGEELARMFYEAVEAGEVGAGGGEYGGEDGSYVDEMEMEMGLGLMEEDEFSD